MQLPLGFTDINSNYLPLLPTPTTSGIAQGLTLLINNQDFAYVTNADVPIVFLYNNNPKNFFINLDYTFDYVSKDKNNRFPIINFYCQVGNSVTNTFVGAGIPIVIKIFASDQNLINIPKVVVVKTNERGLCVIPIQLNFTKFPGTLLTFRAYALQTDAEVLNPGTLIISNKESYDQEDLKPFENTLTNIKSNEVKIQTSSLNSIVLKSNTNQEVILQNQTVTIQNQNIVENVQQLFNDISTITANVETYSSPYETCANSQVEASSRLVQGFTKNELCRYSGWGTKVLAEVHSHLSKNGSSEVQVIDKTVNNNSNINFVSSSSSSVEKYKKILETTGQHVVANSSTYLSAQTNQGNKVEQSYIHQIHAQHIRFNSGANFDVHAGGKVSLVGNQIFTNARWINVASDTYQQIAQHYWLRSENVMQFIAKDTIRYNYNSLQEYSANTLNTTGQKIEYCDVLWNQIGQVNNPPLHPSRSIKSDYLYDGNKKLVYGTAINISMQDYHVVSKYGVVRLRAGKHIKFLADTGGFLFRTVSGEFKVKTSSMTVDTIKRVKIESKSKVFIKAPQVYINCNFNYFDDVIDTGTLETITVGIQDYASPDKIIGATINPAGQVLNEANRVIAQTTTPFINAAGDIQRDVIDIFGKGIGQIINNKTVVEAPFTPQSAINQSLVSSKEALDVLDMAGYIPMTFSPLEDPISTNKAVGGNTTGKVPQIENKQPNPNSINFSGPPGSGASI